MKTTIQKAKKAVDEIIKDLSSRSTIKHVWEDISPKLKREIKKEWASIIENHFKGPSYAEFVKQLKQKAGKAGISLMLNGKFGSLGKFPPKKKGKSLEANRDNRIKAGVKKFISERKTNY